jgi:hypothetical protein
MRIERLGVKSYAYAKHSHMCGCCVTTGSTSHSYRFPCQLSNVALPGRLPL